MVLFWTGLGGGNHGQQKHQITMHSHSNENFVDTSGGGVTATL